MQNQASTAMLNSSTLTGEIMIVALLKGLSFTPVKSSLISLYQMKIEHSTICMVG